MCDLTVHQGDGPFPRRVQGVGAMYMVNQVAPRLFKRTAVSFKSPKGSLSADAEAEVRL